MDTENFDALDKQDMGRLCSGQESALNDLMSRHGQRLFHYLIRQLQDESEAEDVTRERWNRLQLRILLNCSSIWQSVKDVLCNDSPEGHLPEDLDEVPAIDTKDVLSYSFRAIHESRHVKKLKFLASANYVTVI